jgi:hypothetical protein
MRVGYANRDEELIEIADTELALPKLRSERKRQLMCEPAKKIPCAA